ncbi:hypothetical protein GCM10012284_04390 [Mangrovihabitans endophyticus]|uniref:Uncharacterized protein n=1 Tax=Mangrovihabitans endophyticus TaxID=1751298 RepID=A0A8J3BWB3_9ACTN|nr:hypothetical protein GCM10012284_04390 [Mangrovihabitans endophyticus]
MDGRTGGAMAAPDTGGRRVAAGSGSPGECAIHPAGTASATPTAVPATTLRRIRVAPGPLPSPTSPPPPRRLPPMVDINAVKPSTESDSGHRI